MAASMARAGCPLDNTFGFLDGTHIEGALKIYKKFQPVVLQTISLVGKTSHKKNYHHLSWSLKTVMVIAFKIALTLNVKILRQVGNCQKLGVKPKIFAKVLQRFLYVQDEGLT